MRTELAFPELDLEETESLILLYHARSNPYLLQVKLRLEKRKSLAVRDATSLQEIMDAVNTAGSGLLFFAVRNLQELKQVTQSLRSLQGMIQANALRVLAVTDMEDPRALALLKGRGCLEVFPTRLMWNSLESNINQSLSILTMHKLMSLTPKRADGPREISNKTDTLPGWDATAPFDPELESKLKVWMGSSEPKDPRLIEAKVLEFGEENLVLDVDGQIFSPGKTAVLILDGLDNDFDDDRAAGGESKAKILVTITAVVPSDDGHELVSVSVESRLRKYLIPTEKKYAKLQVKVMDFLKAARGW